MNRLEKVALDRMKIHLDEAYSDSCLQNLTSEKQERLRKNIREAQEIISILEEPNKDN